MPDIKKIEISSGSGFVFPEYVYKDTLTVTADTICYSCIPAEESEKNPKRDWSYTTDNPVFAQMFEELTRTIPGVLEVDPGRGMFDVGYVSFLIIYDDGTSADRTWYLPRFVFEECLEAARKMVPSLEEIPKVLRTKR